MPNETTERDAVLDTIAALDMYAGSFGAEDVTIEEVTESNGNVVLVTLSNGDIYELRVRQVRA